ncbi:MAG: hypothetical protein GY789_07815 [Hyphomicrobiales bacterium]|nr:hypothetical protein [Hyphomicrobiales bacterium]MCP4998698.1 hypothetical protein [Hyphomicrobiales bacterium]
MKTKSASLSFRAMTAKVGTGGAGGILELTIQSVHDKALVVWLARAVDTVQGIASDGLDWAPPLPDPSKIPGVAFNNREPMKKAHRDQTELISFATTGKGAGLFKRGHKSLLIDEETGTIGIACHWANCAIRSNIKKAVHNGSFDQP